MSVVQSHESFVTLPNGQIHDIHVYQLHHQFGEFMGISEQLQDGIFQPLADIVLLHYQGRAMP